MKTRYLLLLLLLMGYTRVQAQDEKLVTIKAGNRITDVLTPSDIFLYPEFTSGTVYFRNGTHATAMMNYNSLSDQMLFIDPKGDTLAIKDEKTIKLITLDKEAFYYDEGYIRLVTDNSVIKLAEKQVWEVADVRKIGSHNRPSTTFDITSYSTLTDRTGKTQGLLLNEDLVLRKKATYYFGDQYNRFVVAGKKHLLSLYSKIETSLSRYLKENKIHFDKKDDLVNVTRFLAQNQ